ncbi:hypothetical protein BU26DRAFT_419971 [Trematosphaeria pertusa]|uniref:DNA mismatch repair protein S5 domain-containing protein n=1 Tax=Trematosphaeria pertusa TaxID=390896 RepID=A0A6A6IVP9_9PLEO|nr:uncharacterized protein BU26DRAFT_419971 [Trematosphaeria pertusa]KAF2253273.1 hypothetical protein BU26DRAFT_419971 [Trematosphaeria pertusa]
MADNADPDPLPSIAALPQSTVRQLGSSQVLIDPSSAVKELIDNALDARASAVFVDIANNTLDSIQVKDTGHGIPQEDRPLVCRRYCTSKIRDFDDLKEVRGRWLGFRGEAMTSMAEMSGTLEITTRVEGEPVAVKLKYGRNGKLASTERASAPVGTTVKLTDLFKFLPVRKQAALKHSSKWLAKIRRLMQAYALARPTVRFSLRVLKAKSKKNDFVYAPKKDANVEDAVLKVIGKDCALQCDWTAMETDGFEIQAFLPKPNAIGSKVANQGSFVSIDSRPVSASRGTLKQVVTTFRERLRNANPTLVSVKDPFFSMNINCPSDCYDANIEPAKDDVLFENGDSVVSAVDKLLMLYYPEARGETAGVEEEAEQPTSAQPELRDPSYRDNTKRSKTPISIHEDSTPLEDHELVRRPPKEQTQWRSTMYGIDEEDLELLSDDQRPVIEEEEGRLAADVSNPWTIARMNAAMKPKKPANTQLMTPAKTLGNITTGSSSPAPATNLRQQRPVEPLTPQTSSRMNMPQSSLDTELERSISRLPRPTQRRPAGGSHDQTVDEEMEIVPSHSQDLTSLAKVGGPLPFSPITVQRPSTQPFEIGEPTGSSTRMNAPGIPLDMIPSSSAAPRRPRRKQQPRHDAPYSSESPGPSDEWFGQPMRRQASSKALRSRKQKPPHNPGAPIFASSNLSSPRKPVLNAADRLVENRLYSENNADIRDFFRQNRNQHQKGASGGPSPVTNALRTHNTIGSPPKNRDMAAQFRAYVEREDPSRDLSASPTRRARGPRNPPAHETAPKARPARRRTIDGPLRRKSSRLPLESIPHAYRIHGLVLPVAVRMRDLERNMRKLGMSRNSLEWGYPAGESSYYAFSVPVTDGKLRDWVVKIDEMLECLYEKEDVVDVRAALDEGVKDAVKAHHGGAGEGLETFVVVDDDDEEEEDDEEIDERDLTRVEEWTKQVFAANNEDTVGVLDPAVKNVDGVEESADEFGDAIEDDEMLLDF